MLAVTSQLHYGRRGCETAPTVLALRDYLDLSMIRTITAEMLERGNRRGYDVRLEY